MNVTDASVDKLLSWSVAGLRELPGEQPINYGSYMRRFNQLTRIDNLRA